MKTTATITHQKKEYKKQWKTTENKSLGQRKNNLMQDSTFNRPITAAQHCCNTRSTIQNVQEDTYKLPEEMQEIDLLKTLSFLINTIIDNANSEVDLSMLVCGIETLENKVNAITCPTTGKHLEFRHLIKDPKTKTYGIHACQWK